MRTGGRQLTGWKAIAALPHAVVAAPSPAYQNMIFGGDDGALASQTMQLKENHPGFSNQILKYDDLTDKWELMDTVQKLPVTTTMVQWNGQLVIPGGEIRPAKRTNTVLIAKPCNK